MVTSLLRTLIQRFQKTEGSDSLDDAELLRRFAQERDEAAFEVLLWRHGPMVLGVCRRLLGRTADAEDAFQAVFLVLVRKGGGIRKSAALAGWLYRVAYRIALDLKKRRRSRNQSPLDDVACADVEPLDDMSLLVSEEVHHLPEKYRQVVILCYLQGRSTADAAQALGCPRGTILSRLATARERLRRRLLQRGVGLATALAVLEAAADASELSAALAAQVRRAALAFAAGKFGMISPRVLLLTRGTLRNWFLFRVLPCAGVFVLLCGGVVWLGSVLSGGEKPSAPGAELDEERSALPAAAFSQANAELLPGDEFTEKMASLKDPNVFTRRKALQWFASIEVNPAQQMEVARQVARLLNEGNAFEKADAAKALEKWAGREQVPALADALEEKLLPIGTRPILMRTLGRLRDERAIAALARMLANPFEHREAAAALIEIGPSVTDEVLKYLGHERFSTQVSACLVLEKVGTSRSLAGLQQALSDFYPGHREVANAAAAAIAAIRARNQDGASRRAAP